MPTFLTSQVLLGEERDIFRPPFSGGSGYPRSLEVLTLASLVAVLVVAMAIAAGSDATYQPLVSARFCNSLAADFPSTVPYNDPFLVGAPGCPGPSSPAVDTAYDVSLEYSLPGGHSLAGGPLIAGVPPDGFTAPDASITDGSKVGGIAITMTIGLLNGPCATPVAGDYVLYESTTSATALVEAGAPGTPNRFGSLATDADSDGIAEASSAFVGQNPGSYPRLLDPDRDGSFGPNGDLLPIQPLARYTGMSRVPAPMGDWSVATVLVLSPGSLAPFAAHSANTPHPFARAGRAPAGDTVLALIIDDPTGVVTPPATATDACSPLSAKLMMKGAASSGQVRGRTPPTAGTRNYSLWSYSERDQDGDGIANPLDTCPYVANTGVDSDSDGIDNACDDGSTPGNTDVDADGFMNRQDNCPQVQYFSQIERDELTVPYSSAAPNGGPRTDGIGDQCDAAPTVANGAFIEHYAAIPRCIAGTDADSDGYCAAQDPNDGSASVKGYSLNGGPDQDGVPTGDGFGANVEVYVGTAPLVRCPATSIANDEPVDAWPSDFDDNQSVNVTDVLALKAPFGQTVPPAPVRNDIVPSLSINVTDVLAQKVHFGTSCTPPP